jgi:hypothetical protein
MSTEEQYTPQGTIYVEKAGTLSTFIAKNDKYQITDLRLTGNLNGTDIKFIREMARYGVNGKLAILNLADANIVGDGSSYYSVNNAISEDMFFGCTSLRSVTIPNSVTSIGEWAFSGCTGLTSITIGNSVTSIGKMVFQGCTSLRSVTIPNSVTSIGEFAFYGCESLRSVTIPNSVTSIGDYAFYGCTSLAEIHCKNPTPPSIGSYCFNNVNKTTCKLYIPKGSYFAYWLSDWGYYFENVIEEDVSAIYPISKDNISINTLSNGLSIEKKQEV